MENVLGYVLGCKTCQKVFVVCRPCYRGQKYCSNTCRSSGYALSRKAARQKFEKTIEAKLDHRDRSQRYRQTMKQKSVTDKSSPKIESNVFTPQSSHLKLNQLPQMAYCLHCGKEVWTERRIVHGRSL